MNKEKVLEGLEKIHITVYSAQATLKHNDFERAKVLMKNICLDSKYYLKHIQALERAYKKSKGKGLDGARSKTRKKGKVKKKIVRKRVRK